MDPSSQIGQAHYQLFELEDRRDKMRPREVEARCLILKHLIEIIEKQPDLSPTEALKIHKIKTRLDMLQSPSLLGRVKGALSHITTLFTDPPMSAMLTADEIKKHIPEGLFENEMINPPHLGWYLRFQGTTDRKLRTACEEVLSESMHFASFNLKQEIGRYGIRSRGEIKNAIPILAAMLQDPRCALEYLDVSYSGMTVDELLTILKNIPQESKLKYIYFGPQDQRGPSCITDTALEKLSHGLKETNSPAVVLGLSEINLLVPPETVQRLAEADIQREAVSIIRKYHAVRAPNVSFDAKPPTVTLPSGTGGGTTYH